MNETLSTIGDRIRVAQEKSGKAVSDICRSIGVGRSAYSQWTSNITSPTLTNIEKLANELNVSAAWLAFGMSEGGAEQFSATESDPSMWQIPELTTGSDGSVRTLRSWSLPKALIEYHFRGSLNDIAAVEIAEHSVGELNEYDYVIIDRSVTVPNKAGFYILARKHSLPVRHVTVVSDDPLTVRVRGAEEFNDDVVEDASSLHVLGRVVGILKKPPVLGRPVLSTSGRLGIAA